MIVSVQEEIHMFLIFPIYRDFYTSLESNIKSDRELLVHIMINLRSRYMSFCSSSEQSEVVKASQEGTLLGVIEEVNFTRLVCILCTLYIAFQI